MNAINPKKLLNSKWTATNPLKKEKHFIISKVKYNEGGDVIRCSIEAVISKNTYHIFWQELKNNELWLHGWQ